MAQVTHYDWIIVGSGFGGSVSALRLSEKGYRVLVIEKGLRFKPQDFAENNRDIKRWYWLPKLGMRGIFQMSFFDHMTVVHGVGVGGGSLTYACTLPTPADAFFAAPSWAHLTDWKTQLAPHYRTALRMLGATLNETDVPADRMLAEVARDMGRAQHFSKTRVSIYFGEPGKRASDPYFHGRGPDRVGCTQCGACMTGCRVGAKNTLDVNYLYLAEKLGCTILPETEVLAVRVASGAGYTIDTRCSTANRDARTFSADRVVLAGGVLGTVPLLLKMKEIPDGLPRLSDRLGDFVRTNSESLINVTANGDDVDYSRGIAISSILHTDEHSHLEPVRYGAGSNFFQPLLWPHAPGDSVIARVARSLATIAQYPGRFWAARRAPDMSRRSTILLYMRSLEGTLKLRLGRSPLTGFRRGLVSRLDAGTPPPRAFMAEATALAWRFADKMKGLPQTLFTETVLGTPTTAHILGGCCMGDSAANGVIDHRHQVYGYRGLYIIDGSAMSANPGVNPSLTITALAERAMSFIEAHPTRSAAG